MTAKSQQFLSWKSESVMYDWKINDFIVLSDTVDHDSLTFTKSSISIKRRKIFLDKKREISKWSDKTGITTIYEVISDNKIVVIRVIETLKGISKLVIMNSPHSDYGTAFILSKISD